MDCINTAVLFKISLASSSTFVEIIQASIYDHTTQFLLFVSHLLFPQTESE